MKNFEKHLIHPNSTVKEALQQLDHLASEAILFIVDKDKKLIGSLTDGDVRRGLIKNLKITDEVRLFIQKQPKFIRKNSFTVESIIELRNGNFKIIPILDDFNVIINIINLRTQQSYLPVDAIIMAGGKGTRLMPLTKDTPKPLLKVGEKPIIEHNIDRLTNFGVTEQFISIKYLGDQIKDYFGNGKNKNININYITEDKPLGTIGAISSIKENLIHDVQIVMNSDLLTNINFEEFYTEFINENADFAIATIPYEIKVPYAVLVTEGKNVTDFKEKPTYTYYSNAGIYLMKKEIIDLIPINEFYNTTDLMEDLIKKGKKVISFPILGYWLDVGKHEDYEKAQSDVKKIKF